MALVWMNGWNVDMETEAAKVADNSTLVSLPAQGQNAIQAIAFAVHDLDKAISKNCDLVHPVKSLVAGRFWLYKQTVVVLCGSSLRCHVEGLWAARQLIVWFLSAFEFEMRLVNTAAIGKAGKAVLRRSFYDQAMRNMLATLRALRDLAPHATPTQEFQRWTLEFLQSLSVLLRRQDGMALQPGKRHLRSFTA